MALEVKIQPKSVSIIAVSLFLIIVLLPIIYMFAASIVEKEGLTVAHYREVLSEERQVGLLFNTLILGLGTSLFSVLIGVPLAFLIKRTNLYFRKYFGYLYLAPILIPPYINTIAWIGLLGKQGRLNLFLMRVFSTNAPFFSIFSLGGTILILTLSYFPFVSLLTMEGLSSVDQRLEEAARITHRQTTVIRRITLPLVTPYILCGATFVFIFAITDYGVPALLRVNTYPVEIFTQFSAFYNPQVATATSSVLILITLMLILLQSHFMGKRSYVTIGSGLKRARVINLGRWRIPGFMFVSLVIFVSVVLPIGILLARSQSPLSYKIAFQSSWREIFLSFFLAFVAATLIIIIGFFISYIIERTMLRGRKGLDITTLLPFAIPATVLGIGLIKLYNRQITQFIYSSWLIIVFGYIGRFSPFAIRAISSNFKQINKNLEEAAVICNVRWLKRLFRLLLPLTLPGLLAGWIIAFILCMGELGTTLLVIPPGKATLPIKIYTLMHYGAGKLVASLSIILIIMTLMPILTISWLARPLSHRVGETD